MTNGIDAIEIERIAGVLERHGERFLGKVYTEREIAHCQGRVNELAARFAAKEAISKALGTGLRGVYWREMEIVSDPRGKPVVVLHMNAKRRAENLGITDLGVSLTHSRDLAIAVVTGLMGEPA